MRRNKHLLTPARLAALLFLGMVLTLSSVACSSSGGSNDDHVAAVIHRLLVAAGGSDSAQLQSYPGRLPEGLTVDVPGYPGADIVVSSRRPVSGSQIATPDASGHTASPTLYFVVYDTKDSRQKVLDHYSDTLSKSPWQLESTYSTQELDMLQFVKADDSDIAGVVSIARGGGDEHTSILISLQDAGAFRETQPPYDPGESLEPPRGFPEDVPVPDGATIISSALLSQTGSNNYLVDFISKDSADNIIAYYRQLFSGYGWTVQPGQPLGVEQRLDFHDAVNDVQGDMIVDVFPADGSYTEVKLQVAVNPNRTPASGTPVTVAPATPSPATQTPAPRTGTPAR